MATTLEEIKSFLEEEGMKYKEHKGRIGLICQTDNYIDKDGDKSLLIIIAAEENGEFLKVFTPRAWEIKDAKKRLPVMDALLQISWRTKMIQFEFDPSDGEIRAIIEYPLEDAKLTRKQLVRTITGLWHLIDDFDPVVRRAMTEGVVRFDDGAQQLKSVISDLASLDPAVLAQVLAEVRRRQGAGASSQAPSEL